MFDYGSLELSPERTRIPQIRKVIQNFEEKTINSQSDNSNTIVLYTNKDFDPKNLPIFCPILKLCIDDPEKVKKKKKQKKHILEKTEMNKIQIRLKQLAFRRKIIPEQVFLNYQYNLNLKNKLFYKNLSSRNKYAINLRNSLMNKNYLTEKLNLKNNLKFYLKRKVGIIIENENDYIPPDKTIFLHLDIRTFNFKFLSKHVNNFDVILMDPPWNIESTTPKRGVNLQYPTLNQRPIKNLKLETLSQRGNFLFF
ncbi:mt-a70 family protein [Anaeramoeba flamelloides]|uniref:Mt-a70 family protein n=1 Tax=Anaeramoeba flamelloides TaxID=1746091 RepID=A0ABQ8Y9S2_9EUKA|nr:mt-a70 family protein [Anaeramoeba flamelloides]